MARRPSPAPEGQRLWRDAERWLATIGACVGMLLGATALAPGLDVPIVPGFLLAFSAVGFASIAAGMTCPMLPRRALAWLLVPVVVLFSLPESTEPSIATAALVAASLLFGGSLLGAVVGREVEQAGYLLYVAVVSSAVDVASVFHPSGPSAVIAESPRALSVVAVPFPILGTDRIGPMLGVGDVVFTALYLAACRRHGLSRTRTLVALALGFVATAVVVAWLERPIPALPVLGAAVVAAHPQARRVPIADRRKGMLTVGVIVAVCAVVLLTRYR